ncbi:hypothetical protein ScPMuIL_013022 [Solemya velum]
MMHTSPLSEYGVDLKAKMGNTLNCTRGCKRDKMNEEITFIELKTFKKAGKAIQTKGSKTEKVHTSRSSTDPNAAESQLSKKPDETSVILDEKTEKRMYNVTPRKPIRSYIETEEDKCERGDKLSTTEVGNDRTHRGPSPTNTGMGDGDRRDQRSTNTGIGDGDRRNQRSTNTGIGDGDRRNGRSTNTGIGDGDRRNQRSPIVAQERSLREPNHNQSTDRRTTNSTDKTLAVGVTQKNSINGTEPFDTSRQTNGVNVNGTHRNSYQDTHGNSVIKNAPQDVGDKHKESCHRTQLDIDRRGADRQQEGVQGGGYFKSDNLYNSRASNGEPHPTSTSQDFYSDTESIVSGISSNTNISEESNTPSFKRKGEEKHTQRKTKKRKLGALPNVGATCYANSVFQVLAQTPGLIECLDKGDNSKQERPVLTRRLRALLHQITSQKKVKRKTVNRLMNYVTENDTSFEVGHQNDCHSFLLSLINMVKEEMGEGYLQLFQGKQCNRFSYSTCDHEEDSDEQLFHSLLISVQKREQGWSVEKGLEMLVQMDEYEGNVIPCRICEERQEAAEAELNLEQKMEPVMETNAETNSKRGTEKESNRNKSDSKVKRKSNTEMGSDKKNMSETTIKRGTKTEQEMESDQTNKPGTKAARKPNTETEMNSEKDKETETNTKAWANPSRDTCEIPMNIDDTVTTKRTLIKELPDILILHIGRFEEVPVRENSQFNKLVKMDCNVEYEEEMDISKFCHQQEAMYRLYAVISHSGNLQGGHYYANVRKLSTKEWFYCSDSNIQPTSCDKFKDNSAYVLFYAKEQHITKF